MRTTLTALLALLAHALPLLAQGQTIYRCGNSYSQTPCAGGHAVDDVLSTLHGSTQAAPGQATVYLCQGQGGGQFWSATHCAQHQALIERMETVPASLPWPQQVQQAQRQWEQAIKLTATATQTPAPRPGSRRGSEAAHATRVAQQSSQRETRHAAACSKLQARIAQLDSKTATSAASLEKLRNTRRKAQDDYRQKGC